MVKAVVFDCFGVLYGGSLFTLLNLCPPEKRQQLADLNKQNDWGYLEFDAYVSGIGELIGRTPAEVQAILAQKRVRNEPLFDFIREIKSPDVKIGLLSNAGRDMPGALFSDSELNGELFDAVVVSSAVGTAKPSVDIFTLMADKLGLSPSQCIMVDDLFENCNGAELADMKAVWYADNITAQNHIREFLHHA